MEQAFGCRGEKNLVYSFVLSFALVCSLLLSFTLVGSLLLSVTGHKHRSMEQAFGRRGELACLSPLFLLSPYLQHFLSPVVTALLTLSLVILANSLLYKGDASAQ
jgi:multidrug efflux pump subunit AcrB